MSNECQLRYYIICMEQNIVVNSEDNLFEVEKSATALRKSGVESASDSFHKFILPWSHYQIIMRENDSQARSFYKIEAYNQQWSVRQIQC